MMDLLRSPFLVLLVTGSTFLVFHLTGRLPNPPVDRRPKMAERLLAVTLTLAAVCTILNPPIAWVIITGMLTGALTGWITGRSLPEKTPGETRKPLPLSSRQVTVAVFSLIALGLLLRLPHLENYGLRWDEHWHLRTAVGYLRTGDFMLWDLVEDRAIEIYDRGRFYTWQVAQAVKYSGVRVGPTRYLALAWGLVLFVPFYVICRDLSLWGVWLLLAFFWASLSPVLITLSRWSRFYVIFVPVYLGFVHLTFRCIEGKHDWKKLGLLLVPTVLLGSYSLYLHPMSLLFLPALALYCFVQWIDGNQSSISITLLLLGSIILPGSVGLYAFWDVFLEEILLLGEVQWDYLVLLTLDRTGFLLGGIFLPGIALLGRRSSERYYVCVAFVPVLFLMFLTHRTAVLRYVLPSVILMIPLFVVFLRRLVNTFGSEDSNVLLSVVIVVLLVLPLYELPRRLNYIWSGQYGYIHLPGTVRPEFRSFTRWFNENAEKTDALVVFHGFYFKYYNPIYSHRLEATPSIPQLLPRDHDVTLDRLQKLESENNVLWVAVAGGMLNRLPEDIARHLHIHYKPVLPEERFDMWIFRNQTKSSRNR